MAFLQYFLISLSVAEYSILAGNLNKSTEQIITVSDVGLIQLKFVDEKQYLDILKNY